MKKLTVSQIGQLVLHEPGPCAFMLIGPPCVGKSTFIAQLQDQLANRIHLCSTDNILDAWALTNGKTYSDAHKELNFKHVKQQMMAEATAAVKEGMYIAFDQTNLKLKARRPKLELLRYAKPAYTVFAITFPYTEKLLEERNVARSKVAPLFKYIPKGILKDMIDSYVGPHPVEGFHHVIELIPSRGPLLA